jgi:TPR repeat protein
MTSNSIQSHAPVALVLRAEYDQWFVAGILMHWESIYGKKNDEAMYFWSQRAAFQGHIEARFIVGLCFMKESGVGQCYRTALMWFLRASDVGCAKAQYAAGLFYRQGLGMDKPSEAQAKKYLKKAADQGYEMAKKALEETPKKRKRGS